jgi:glycerophosphoryl diester phosphodiesterase
VRVRPQVVAHRGASYGAPEHTLAAYLMALDEGADALECDVRLTRDGTLVCVHDRRLDRTSSGRGALSRFSLAELEQLDFRAGFAVEAPDRDATGVLTLERLLSVVADAGVQLAVETKHPTRYAGLVEVELVELLDRFGWAGRGRHSPVRVMSFAPSSLRRLRQLAPELPTVLLLDRLPVRYRTGRLPGFATAAGPALSLLRAHPEWVAAVRDAGRPVHVWTVNDVTDARFVAGLGVDAVITDRPGAIRRALRPADRA